MARKISEIEAEFDTNLANQAELFDATGQDKTKLSSLASTSMWKLFRSVLAASIFILENLWDSFKAQIQSLIDSSVIHNVAWFHARALEFQYGDLLVVVNNKPGYQVVDESKQIIKRVAIVENAGYLTVKVAKEEGGVIIPLTTDEMSAYAAYWDNVKPAGVALLPSSIPSDKLKIEGEVVFDPLVGAAKTDENTIAQAKEYLTNLEFNGGFIKEKMDNSVQTADGVKGARFNLKYFIKGNGETYSEVNKERIPLSGYIELVEDDCTITYTPG